MIWVLIAIITVWLGAIPVFVLQDRRTWNGGVCRKCGGRLHHADTDSQGGKLWVCEQCHCRFWTSWIRGNWNG